eukprot:4188531-Amphidinium_carterae.1
MNLVIALNAACRCLSSFVRFFLPTHDMYWHQLSQLLEAQPVRTLTVAQPLAQESPPFQGGLQGAAGPASP